MKTKFLFLLIFCSCYMKSEKQDLICIQVNDRNGFSETISSKDRLSKYKNENFLSSQPYKKVIRIFKNYKNNNKISKLTSYYDNGMIEQYLEALNGRAFGKYIKWHKNGKKSVEAKVIGGSAGLNSLHQSDWIFDGICRAFDKEGNLISTFNYKVGKLEKEAIYYFPSKKIKRIENYKNDFLDGKFIEFDEDGKVIYESFYEKGKKEGVAKKYFLEKLISLEKYEKGLLKEGSYFEKDKLISKIKNGEGIKYIFKNGLIEKTVQYKKGKAEGKVEIFKDKKLLKEFFIKDEKKEGEEIEYFLDTGVKKLSINWKKGGIKGFVKTYYPNSNIRSQTEIIQNKKNGISTVWYEDGNLMFIEKYEKDVLKEGSYYKKEEEVPFSEVIKGSGVATIFCEDGTILRSIKYRNSIPQDE